MSTGLFVAISIGFVIVVAAAVAAVTAPRLDVITRVVAILPVAVLMLVCAFGFAASFEPGDHHGLWRVLYAIVFLACAIAAGRLALARRVTR